MVTVITKLKNSRKPLIWEIKTVKEAQRIKKFVGKEGKVEIRIHRKPSKKKKKNYWWS